jgi:hypothetical protein
VKGTQTGVDVVAATTAGVLEFLYLFTAYRVWKQGDALTRRPEIAPPTPLMSSADEV